MAINIVLPRLKSYSFRNNFPSFCVFYTEIDFYEDDFELLLYSGQFKKRANLRAFLDKSSISL